MIKKTFVSYFFLYSILLTTDPSVVFSKSKDEFDRSHKTQAHFKEGATLWFQKAAEVRGLFYQAFNLARLRVELDNQKMKSDKKNRKRAIIVDIDETILDNSPYQARNILLNRSYPDGWKEWVNESNAKSIPGAVEFLEYAHNSGIEIFYITNRKEETYASTLKNLQKRGLPIKASNLIMRKSTSDKSSRRMAVAKNYRIVLLMGDNLNDFSDHFAGKSISNRLEMADKFREEFGKKFILLPNPMYGDWEAGLYGYDYNKDDIAKLKSRRAYLDLQE